MWQVCELYTMRSPSMICIGKFVIYISCVGVILPLNLNFICICIDIYVWIDIFVNFIPYNCRLYFILGIFSYISPIYGLFSHCIVVTFIFVLIFFWMLYLCLMQYAGVLHMVWCLVVLHIGNLVMQISRIWFVMQLLTS